jgi:hypothetical protein
MDVPDILDLVLALIQHHQRSGFVERHQVEKDNDRQGHNSKRGTQDNFLPNPHHPQKIGQIENGFVMGAGIGARIGRAGIGQRGSVDDIHIQALTRLFKVCKLARAAAGPRSHKISKRPRLLGYSWSVSPTLKILSS